MLAQKSNTISRRTAVHEAGHAVVALLEHQQFDDIIVGTTDGVAAVVQNMSYRANDDEVVRIALAGIMAARLTRRSWRSPFLDTAFDDMGMVADFFRNSENVDLLLDYNITRTETLLLENWAAVTQIAKLFRRQRAVSHRDAITILKNSESEIETPEGQLGNDKWKPLEEYIQWRIQYPNGLPDVMASITRENAP